MTCKAELHIADNYGDNEATMVCDLERDHLPPHRHEFKRNGTPVVVTFECDERYEPCRECETLTLKHQYGGDDDVGRLRRCKICYAMTCEACQPKHLCPCDRCEQAFPGAELVAQKKPLYYYCKACDAAAEGEAGDS